MVTFSGSALAVRATPFVFVLIWASGFVVAEYAAPYAEPLSFLLLRYGGVLVLMTALAVIARAPWPGRAAALHIGIAGLGIHAGYLGGVWVAVAEGMPSGVAALVVNLQPALTAIVAWLLGSRLGRLQGMGLILGFAGVALVLAERLTVDGLSPFTLGMTVMALLATTAGTLYQKQFCPQFDLRTGQVVQFAASILVTLPFAMAFESFRVDWTPQLIGSLVWSVLGLTGGGISLLFLMLRRGAATQVTSYFYLLPAVTAVLALLMFGGSLGPIVITGMAVTVVGVVMATRTGATAPATVPPAGLRQGEGRESRPATAATRMEVTMASEEEIKARVLRSDEERSATRADAAACVHRLAADRDQLLATLAEHDRALGEAVAQAEQVMTFDELAGFTGRTPGEVREWAHVRSRRDAGSRRRSRPPAKPPATAPTMPAATSTKKTTSEPSVL